MKERKSRRATAKDGKGSLCIRFLSTFFNHATIWQTKCILRTHARTHTHTQPFYGPFSGTTRMSRCQKTSASGLYGAREDNRGRHTDHLAGRHSIRTNQQPTPNHPHLYAGCPSCRNPANLSRLRTGTKYAGLHTQWLGYEMYITRVVFSRRENS